MVSNKKEERCSDMALNEIRQVLEAKNQEFTTQQKQLLAASDRVEKLNERLKLVNQIKDEFVSMIVHELRNPLASISQGIECAREFGKGELSEKSLRYLELAMRNVKRLNQLMDDLLDLAKLESGKFNIDLDIVIPHALLEDAKLIYMSEAEQASVSILVDDSSTDIAVLADPNRIEQVVGNLISNAIKFTPADGKIILSATLVGPNVLFSITDTGSGIAKEYHETIFEKYRQLGAHEGGGKKGTGLGLPICRHLIKLHGGTIGVESESGRGSRFFFTLPKYSIQARIAKLADKFCNHWPIVALRFDTMGGANGWRPAYRVLCGLIGEREWPVVDPNRGRIWILSENPEKTQRRLEQMLDDGRLSGTFVMIKLSPLSDIREIERTIDKD